ncbi:hypothetical protein EYC84_005617 [Monilinia fructicola]|uniref:Uncharacterized protein n=1 Tax=Monilinia fructicola TaxID=38448 RepID=A0A5M9JZZ6_MONFR|nr:hypothetical protein EYC84_005617 [Monilinia fructicola]
MPSSAKVIHAVVVSQDNSLATPELRSSAPTEHKLVRKIQHVAVLEQKLSSHQQHLHASAGWSLEAFRGRRSCRPV